MELGQLVSPRIRSPNPIGECRRKAMPIGQWTWTTFFNYNEAVAQQNLNCRDLVCWNWPNFDSESPMGLTLTKHHIGFVGFPSQDSFPTNLKLSNLEYNSRNDQPVRRATISCKTKLVLSVAEIWQPAHPHNHPIYQSAASVRFNTLKSFVSTVTNTHGWQCLHFLYSTTTSSLTIQSCSESGVNIRCPAYRFELGR